MILKIYEFFKTHIALRWLSLFFLTVVLVISVLRLSYKEDISDFLPLGTEERESLAVYQDISGATRLFVIFNNPGDNDKTVEAVNHFCEILTKIDTAGWTRGMTARFDMDKINEIQHFVYQNIPYFLTASDYARMDSLLSRRDFIDQQLQKDHEMLMFPDGGILSQNISYDPLGLFTPVLERLREHQHDSHFEIYEGCLFTPDMSRAIVMIPSPFGNAETERNAMLIDLINNAIDKACESSSEVKAHVAGGPAIAVENARCIKHDSAIAVSLSVIIILVILLYSFRSPKNIVLIGLSIGWGWLFAIGGISLLHDNVSLIVIGISSIILGIAVNYPLHLVAHIRHQPDMRLALKEIFVPLLVGNITTVGAFLTLVPLQSTALRDLGLFASLLLVGTILFVLVYLPHHVVVSHEVKEIKLLSRISSIRLENKRWMVVVVAVLTLVLAWFGCRTEFDSNMANINYMSEQQRNDMSYFQRLETPSISSTTKTVFIVSSASTIDDALCGSYAKQQSIDSLVSTDSAVSEGVVPFLVPLSGQSSRLQRWHAFVTKHKSVLQEGVNTAAVRTGFSPEAFTEFQDIINRRYTPQSFEYFEPLTATVFAANISIDKATGRYTIVDKLHIEEKYIAHVKRIFPDSFDVDSMNSALAGALSYNFNYIGLACSVIVFLFLWFSFGRIETAFISFIPMVVGWVWILGVMCMLDVKFNIVNIILATFIFGQGDDYTIFMTEGCQYEYARRRQMLVSYKNSILLSAIIMFIGIGTLIFASHPALHSLAQVTIIGMGSVVFSAWLLPPLLFGWLVKSGGRYRKRPLTIGSVLRTWYCASIWLSQLLFGYVTGFLLFVFTKGTERKRRLFHRLVTAVHRFDMRIFPNVRFEIRNPYGEDFSKPCVIVCNHQSMLDPMCLMALSPNIVIVGNRHASYNPVIRIMFRWLDFYTIQENKFSDSVSHFESLVKQGYSIVVFAEGERNPESSVLRFHKGLFFLGERLGMDIVPVYLHGLNMVMPIHSFATNSGDVTVSVGKRITNESTLWTQNYSETTRRVHRYYKDQYMELCKEKENADYFACLVYERYLYKGAEIQTAVRRSLKRSRNHTDIVDREYTDTKIFVTCKGYGEDALLMALVHRDKTVVAIVEDEEKCDILRYSARGIVDNIVIEQARG